MRWKLLLRRRETQYKDDKALSKLLKKEREEMYSWYVCKPMRSEKKKKPGGSTNGRKAKKEN